MKYSGKPLASPPFEAKHTYFFNVEGGKRISGSLKLAEHDRTFVKIPPINTLSPGSVIHVGKEEKND